MPPRYIALRIVGRRQSLESENVRVNLSTTTPLRLGTEELDRDVVGVASRDRPSIGSAFNRPVDETQLRKFLGPLFDFRFAVTPKSDVIKTGIEVTKRCETGISVVLGDTNYEATGPGHSNPPPPLPPTFDDLGVA